MGTSARMSRGANILAYLLLSFLLLTGCFPASTAIKATALPLAEIDAYRAALSDAESASAQAPIQQPVQQQAGAINEALGLAGLTPRRLIIPKMHVNAPILAEGADATGAMLAPRIGGPNNPIWNAVYWWNVGAAPGQIGNAVIAGHVNRPDGSPSTFTYLNALQPGDKIEVVTASGRILTFTVRAKNAPLVYVRKANDPTVERIFGPAMTPNLNLMTCWGEWDGKEYDRRLVIYSTLDGPSPFPIPAGLANFVGV